MSSWVLGKQEWIKQKSLPSWSLQAAVENSVIKVEATKSPDSLGVRGDEDELSSTYHMWGTGDTALNETEPVPPVLCAQPGRESDASWMVAHPLTELRLP